MPKVDFYTLKQDSEESRRHFACRLVEKAHGMGHQIYLHCASEAEAHELDDLLWSFRPESFLPHALAELARDEDEGLPILIGHASSYDGPTDVLINLSPEIPPFHRAFQRITEIVIDDEAAKQTSRDHWREYQHQGYELQLHKL